MKLTKRVFVRIPDGKEVSLEASATAWKGADQEFPDRREMHDRLSQEVNAILAHEIRKVLKKDTPPPPPADLTEYGII